MDRYEIKLKEDLVKQLKRIADSLENIEKNGIKANCSGVVYNQI